MKNPVNHPESHIIVSFACAGKSFCAKRHPELVLDLESSIFKYNYDDYDVRDIEKYKGTSAAVPNHDFPNNYIKVIKENIAKYPFILITLDPEVLELLEKEKISYNIVAPTSGRTKEFVDNSKKRGSDNPAFIHSIKEWLNPDKIKELRKQSHPENFDFLEKDEYLNDYLLRKYPEYFENEIHYQPVLHDEFTWHNERFELDFYDLTNRPLPNYPWDQIYIIGNLDGKVPVVKYAKEKDGLPGGGIKIGETIEESLQRELKEELNMAALGWHAIGYQHGFDKNGNESFQLRVYANLKKLGDFTKDPGGLVIGNELIDIKDLNKHIDYGKLGDYFIKKWQEQSQK